LCSVIRSAPVVECELPCQSKAAAPSKRVRQCQAMTGNGGCAGIEPRLAGPGGYPLRRAPVRVSSGWAFE